MEKLKTKIQKYLDYKDSEVEWLGYIPKSWKVKRLKHVLKIKNGQDHKHVLNEAGYPVYGSGGQFAYAKDFLYEGEALLLGRKGTIDNPLYVNEKFWTVDTMFYAIPVHKNFTKFLYYLAQTIPFSYYSTSTALPSMTQDSLNNHKISLPSFEEQMAIANFLDEKTAKIDQAIAQKEKLISLLKERKQILIQEAVTKGLDPDVQMKDSGVEWIGEIPEGWEVKSLRYAFKFLNQKRIPLSAVEREFKQGKYPYYGASGIIDYVDDYIFNEKTVLIAEDGANLLSKSTPLAYVAEGKYWVNNHAHILKPKFEGFLYWAELLSLIDYTIYITGAAQPKLSRENLGSVKVVVPPQAEILEIVNKISTISEKFRNTIILQQTQIEKLKEYKATLIDCAVTGKIKVS